MAGSVNKVIIVGNLGADPDVRSTQDGRPIVNLSIATSDRWKDKNTGEPRERTEWHRVVIFNEGLARVAQNYLRKGSTVYIEGQLQTRSYEQDGIKKYSTEIVLQGFNSTLTMLGGRPDGAGGGGGNYGGGQQSGQGGGGQQQSGGQSAPQSQAPAFDNGGMDDDIPF